MKKSITLILLLSLIFIYQCDNVSPIETIPMQETQIDIENAEEMEAVLRAFAKALPEAMEDVEITKMVYNEVDENIEYEAYALWSAMADKQTPNGKTLRKVFNSELSNTLGKVNDISVTTETFDRDNRLQVYIHNFDKWNGKDQLHVAYEPLTINDVDITEIEVYKPNGESYIMDISNKMWEPDFPIIIVGLNESMDGEYVDLNKVTDGMEVGSSTGFYWTKIYTRKVRDLEPWIKGKAEMVVRSQSSYDCNSIEASTSNSSGSKCSKTRSGTPAWFNGTPRGAKSLNYYTPGPDDQKPIWVFEKDTSNHEWIIDSAILKVSANHTSFWLESINPGQYYYCGSYVRCSYNWSWGCTGTHLDCSGWGSC